MAIDTNYAPIVLFTYSRLLNTMETVSCLLNNKEAQYSDLIVYSDAPKNHKALEGVTKTREYIHSIHGFKTITIIEREKNLGLANSIVDGVTAVVNKYGRAIILEDDLSVSPFFLKYMNEGLERYKDNESIACIHGYMYPHENELPEVFLIKGADCWGWGTWKRAWDCFEFNAESLYKRIIKEKKQRDFDFNYSYSYMDMLKRQIDGKANSWAVCWYASTFLKNMYTFYPNVSLVRLNDVEGSGSTHGSTPPIYLTDVKNEPINWDLASDKDESIAGRKEFERFFNKMLSFKRKLYNLVLKTFS